MSLLAPIYNQLSELLLRLPAARAALIDRLDATISSRASGAYYTSARAAKLDSIDADISSRAPASTALSNGVWTNARAAKLDKLDSIGGSVVKSIQTGYVDANNGSYGGTSGEDRRYADIAISSVNVSKSIVLFNYMGSIEYKQASARLLSSTVVRVSQDSAETGDLYGRFTVLEFY